MIDPTLQQTAPKRGYRRWQGDCNDRQFMDLMRDFRSCGGMLPVEEVRALTYVCSPGSSFSQLLLQNMLFFIVWRRQHWMPCFQFSTTTWLPCASVSAMIQELRPRMGGSELAIWFTRKDALLAGRSPVECLHTNYEEVRNFARQAPFTPLGNVGLGSADRNIDLSDGRRLTSCQRSMS